MRSAVVGKQGNRFPAKYYKEWCEQYEKDAHSLSWLVKKDYTEKVDAYQYARTSAGYTFCKQNGCE